jgi:hypothetical protein
LRNPNAYANSNCYANRDTDADSNCYANRDTDGNANGDAYSNTDGNAYAHPDAERDHAQCACAQGAGQAHGGSHVVPGNLAQHRHLP